MDPDAAANNLRSHYLKVQALSPVTDNLPAPTPTPATAGDNFFNYFVQNPTATAVIIFFIMMLMIIIALVITKVRNVNTMLTLLFLALVTSAMPYGTSLIQQQTRLESKAGPVYTPKNITINQVTASGFIVTWETDSPGLGALRLKTSLDPQEIPTIIPEPEGPATTNHLIKVTTLSPQTRYYLDLLSGAKWYDNHGKPLEIVTP